MSLVFSKDLPQSSITSQESLLCIEKFDNPPRTLYDEIGRQEKDFYSKSAQEENQVDWKDLVYRLQVENTSLVNSLHETNNNLMQSRREKEDLENFIQRQTETTDNIVSRLKDTIKDLNNKLQEQNQEKDDRILDLIFQKNYISLENQALHQNQKELNHYLGIHHKEERKSSLFKWRSCVYALIAIQRFQQQGK